MDAIDDFFVQLLAAFSMESEEHFTIISTGLVELERLPIGDKRRETIETVYRAFHSLKGASRAVDLRDIEAVCQVSESLLSVVKRGEVELSTEMLDDLHRAVDGMQGSLTSPPKVSREALDEMREALASRLPNAAPRVAPPTQASANQPNSPAMRVTIGRPREAASDPVRITSREAETGPASITRREVAAETAPTLPPVASPPRAHADTASRETEPVRVSARDLFKKPAAANPLVGSDTVHASQAAVTGAMPGELKAESDVPAPAAKESSEAERPAGASVQPDHPMRIVAGNQPPPVRSNGVGAPLSAQAAAAPLSVGESGDSHPVPQTQSAPGPRHEPRRDTAALPPAALPHAETIKVGADRLDRVLLQVEELLSVKLAAAHRAERIGRLEAQILEMSTLYGKLASEVLSWNSRIASHSETADPLAKMQELVAAHGALLKAAKCEVSEIARGAEGESRQLDGQLDQLLEDSKKLLLLPMSSVLQAVPKMARDIARDLGKEVDVELVRADTEMDKRILDILKDPVLHIIRNCIDHGIEPPDEREARNKPRRGLIRLTTSPIDSSKIELLIEDDGAGIDIERLRSAALKNGALSPEAIAALDAEQSLGLIFQSGVSTSGIITDLSGRGLGMAIARDTIEEVGGTVAVSSQPGTGTAFRIVLPVSHTTLRCVVFKLEGQTFMAPATNVEQVCRVPLSGIANVAGGRTIALDGVPVPLCRLSDVLRIPIRPVPPPACLQLIIMVAAGTRIACQVDEILFEQETLVKPLGPQLAHVRHISGAAILGTGDAVPILNVREILQTAQETRTLSSDSALPDADAVKRDRILVVEDSITSRMLIKNILEAVDYQVTVAVDGMEALRILKEITVDLVISDVEMPHMDGISLTEHLRKNPQTAELPVILVTSLESREDRERGVSAGANAYIVKRTFDQGNLLDTVQRLI